MGEHHEPCHSSFAPSRPGRSPHRRRPRVDHDPHSVPAGGGLGTTTITWKTGDGSQGQVYVSQDGAAENLFDAGTDDSKEAPWIQTGSTYEFRVYAGSDHKTQLASVKVTRAQ